jgi:hypothetical protein
VRRNTVPVLVETTDGPTKNCHNADPVQDIKQQLNLISLYIIPHTSHTLAAKAAVCVLCEVSAIAEQTVVHSDHIAQQ